MHEYAFGGNMSYYFQLEESSLRLFMNIWYPQRQPSLVNRNLRSSVI